ncbi:MAG: hypothetical protein R3F11_25960 [Verrucomicrobiales bacterium]
MFRQHARKVAASAERLSIRPRLPDLAAGFADRVLLLHEVASLMTSAARTYPMAKPWRQNSPACAKKKEPMNAERQLAIRIKMACRTKLGAQIG